MVILHGAYTDKGIRDENQDDIMVLDKPALHAYAVADGVGGLSFGRQAASMSLTALKKELEDCEATDIKYLKELVKVKLNQINQYIYNQAEARNVRMGTTVALLMLVQDSFILCNVGDTKVFMIRNASVREISKAHSLAEYKNVLTMAVGPCKEIDPHIIHGECRAGDIFIICSDGVYNYLSENAIRDLFDAGMEISGKMLEQQCRTAAEAALKNGSHDNLSIIAVSIQ